MKRTIFLFAVGALMACKGREQVQAPVEEQVNTEMLRPDWVRQRPVSSAYYVGVGLATKGRSDAQETAKKNALNDLASEISVTVEGNSLLYTLDRKNTFDESFTSSIKTSTNEQIEGFELVDSWENGSEYWTYYRLSKAEHARIKAQRKASAMANALDLHKRSRASTSGGDLKAAIDQDLRALIAVKAYWGENDLVELEGKQVALVNEVFGHLQSLTSGIRFAVLPERCELSYANRFKRELLISASHLVAGRSLELEQLPVRISYAGQTGVVTELKNTDVEGRARTSVQRVLVGSMSNEMVVEPDMDALVSKELEPALVSALVKSLTIPQARVPIDLRMPKVHMRALETNFGQPIGDAGIAVLMREELTKQGFRMVDREAEAELVLTLTCSTRVGGEASGFYTAYLDATYAFRDRRTQEVVHEGAKQGVKGIQLNYEKAGLDAYKKAGQDITKELVPSMMNAIQ